MIKKLTESLTVLLVDDDDITNFISSKILKENGINSIDIVGNGELACTYLTKKLPDLIFLDISMPVMDGFQFLEKSQYHHLCPDTYIIMLTSSSRETERQTALKFHNVIDYIEKPLNHSKLEKVLAKI